MNKNNATTAVIIPRNESMEQTMEPIPNWFRWLIIVIATLILCACRAPLQQPPTTHSVLQSSKPIMSSEQSVLTTLMKLRENYNLESRYVATTDPPEPASKFETKRVYPAPIIRRAGDSIRVQDVFQNTDAKSEHQAPIYFRVDDNTFPVQPAQAIVHEPQVTSPFLDDPEIPPVADSVPLAPIVDPRFLQQPRIESQVAPVYPPEQHLVPQRMPEVLVNPTYSGPLVNEYEVAPLAPQIIESAPALAAPFDYLPQAEIPVEVPPEQWATVPSESMAVSYGELANRYPDEYICDGGDAVGEVKVLPDWSLRHLDPEDTIGHYDTLDRTVEVAASNRVCIYAPRFAAVRKVSSPFENEKREQVLIEKRDDLAVTEHQLVSSVSYQQSIAAQRHVRLQPASSLQRDLPGVTGIHVLPVRMIAHDLSVHEDFRVMRLGIHKQVEKARLAKFSAKAIMWSHDKAVQVVVDEVVASTMVARKSLQTIHTIGDNRPAKLRVIKTASVADALPGEEVEFTLRFDNIGHQPMGNVTIIDNLTTRLEYLDDTELCSLKNNFVEDENEVESLTLRWEIIDPIMPGKGGLIRFRCRIR